MGVDSWTRTPHERQARERAKQKSESRSLADKVRDKAKDIAEGTKRCACGCKQQGTAFRGGKLYSPKCVSRGSGWDKSGLPQDRTPPRWHGRKNWAPK
jgi:hypothetical protein